MTTEETLRNIIQSQTGKKIQDFERTTPIDVLPLDSLDWVEIVMRIEQEYVIDIPDRVADGWVTIGDIADYIESHTK